MPILQSPFDPRIRFIKKASGEVVNNSNVLQNDDDLFFDVLVDKTYAFICCILRTTTVGAGFKYQWTEANSNGAFTTFTANAVGTTNTPYSLAGAATEQATTFIGGFRTAIASGTMRLQWAQVNAEVSDTSVNDGSWLLVIEL